MPRKLQPYVVICVISNVAFGDQFWVLDNSMYDHNRR